MQKTLYSQAHLAVSAIRVLEYLNNEPPSIEKVCEFLSFSLEKGNFICHQLHDRGIIKILSGPFGNRLFIRDHTKIEEIENDGDDSTMQAEIEKFQSSRKAIFEKVESFKAQKEQERKDRFAEIEETLKKNLSDTTNED